MPELTPAIVADDLMFANELAEDFGYTVDVNGQVLAEEYSADGEVVANYRVRIEVEKVPVV